MGKFFSKHFTSAERSPTNEVQRPRVRCFHVAEQPPTEQPPTERPSTERPPRQRMYRPRITCSHMVAYTSRVPSRPSPGTILPPPPPEQRSDLSRRDVPPPSYEAPPSYEEAMQLASALETGPLEIQNPEKN